LILWKEEQIYDIYRIYNPKFGGIYEPSSLINKLGDILLEGIEKNAIKEENENG
jgi:hypothetical protein